MPDSDHRFYVKPLTPEANEAIAAYLNDHGAAAVTTEHQHITVEDAVVEGVYEVPHRVITELKRSVHAHSVRYYVQVGDGKIRLYRHQMQQRQRLAKTKVVKSVTNQLARLKGV